ncbi:hypothetical protein CCE01nite_18810 [Cellulomonas cellasea]|uniref:Uncharacterized protein n=1 Tax=Cellulomonas cellasea TaxID=43670 RepID=A0A4Y3KUZ9_9CELL|nr:hypothetical protein CCE01nite_18810 [Cellulomonas cellasea]
MAHWLRTRTAFGVVTGLLGVVGSAAWRRGARLPIGRRAQVLTIRTPRTCPDLDARPVFTRSRGRREGLVGVPDGPRKTRVAHVTRQTRT